MVAGEVCLDEAKIGRNQASKASWQPAPASLSGKVVHGSKTGPVRLASGPSLGIIWGMSAEAVKWYRKAAEMGDNDNEI